MSAVQTTPSSHSEIQFRRCRANGLISFVQLFFSGILHSVAGSIAGMKNDRYHSLMQEALDQRREQRGERIEINDIEKCVTE